MRSSLPLYKIGFFSNRMMNIAFPVCVAAQAAVVVIPTLARLFDVVPLSAFQWLIVAAVSLVPLAVGEVGKLLTHLHRKKEKTEAVLSGFGTKKRGC